MWATLTLSVEELTLPTYSSISLGLLPAGAMRVGEQISVGKRVLLRVMVSGGAKEIGLAEHLPGPVY
jgi:hypothetical protein